MFLPEVETEVRARSEVKLGGPSEREEVEYEITLTYELRNCTS